MTVFIQKHLDKYELWIYTIIGPAPAGMRLQKTEPLKCKFKCDTMKEAQENQDILQKYLDKYHVKGVKKEKKQKYEEAKESIFG
jgi:hypothetical protein